MWPNQRSVLGHSEICVNELLVVHNIRIWIMEPGVNFLEPGSCDDIETTTSPASALSQEVGLSSQV